MKPRDEATERQIQAAHPRASTWLAANAGSGKTRVLTDRVARLLLDGVQPQRILCLTYTKAAAGEMQNRLFRRLGEWAMLDDTALAAALEALGIDEPPDARRLAHARTLFARAIETPGGLKIQTIHSFCASLLRRFPLEAGVSPQFTEVEDRAAALLRAEIIEDFADGEQAGLIDDLAAHVTDASLDALATAIVGKRDAFARPMDRAGLLALFDLPEGYDESRLLAEVFTGGEVALIREILPELTASGGNDTKAAAKLAAFTAADLAGLQVLEDVLLTGANANRPFSARIGAFPKKALREGALADRMGALEALMHRVEAARPRRLALAAVRRAEALHRFAAAFLPEYERRKQLRGWLDFDDLIGKARQLLNDPAVAAWVLFRLDGGIDHILVDEAQDTSPAQWDVIEKLAQEFTSGLGAREGVKRTIFVVGDKKQSIYSFQGADPEAFDRMQAEFGRRLDAIGTGLQSLELEYSFRSSQAILQLVDLVFEGQQAAGFRKESQHRAFKADLPGRVDLWPVVEKSAEEDDLDWTDPVDRPGRRHHAVVLAERIATAIRKLIESGETIPEDGPVPGSFRRRPVRAGDFLILVQRRSDLFSEIIRACKSAGLPIAGQDRLKVGAELAVRDLAALLRFLATPEDDLSLATALKSPLLGWGEQALFDLAHRRGKTFLWEALRARETEFPDTLKILHDLRDAADFLRPYDLIERILTRHDGRRRLLGRLGAEAEDGIDALLSQALSYERSEIPSLTGFLGWMETDDLEIKRQLGSVGDMIRVMTVHGAKGLESPIVILPDTARRRAPPPDSLVTAEDVALWNMPGGQSPALIARAQETLRERQRQERLRLLYVAMTRAEKWLIVAAAGDLDRNGDSWYQRIEAAMKRAGAVREDGVLRLSHGDWTGPDPIRPAPQDRHVPPLPGFMRHPPAPPPPRRATVSPSDLGGAKALPTDAGQDEEAALLHGTRVHRLLELLPDIPCTQWAQAAANILPDAPPQARAAALSEARTVLTAAHLAHVFGPGSLAEVALTAQLGSRRIHGAIDRLILSGDRVTAVDFKTNTAVPKSPAECPEGVLRQMGAYAHALARIYPRHRIETAVLWTRKATLMVLPPDSIARALARAGSLDLARGPA